MIATLAAAIALATALIVERPGEPPEQVAEAASIGATALPAADTTRLSGVPDEVYRFLSSGQAWRAARVMRGYMERSNDTRPEALLLAARVEAGWGGWTRVRSYLEGEEWLAEVADGEGWFLLGRALEEEERWSEAVVAFQRFREVAPGSGGEELRLVARLREGLALMRLDRADEAATLLGGMREHAPDIADRIDVLAAEALAPAGDSTAVRQLVEGLVEPSLRERGRRAQLAALEAADDPARALRLARSLRAGATAASDRAWYAHFAARMAIETGDEAAADEELRAAVSAAPSSAAAGAAARLLESRSGLTPADRLALARTFDARGDNRRAISHYRAWLAAGIGDEAERARVIQALGQALFDSGDFPAAISTVAPLGTPEAIHLAGRAEYRRGNSARGRETFLRLARDFPGSRPGSEALFHVADLEHDDQDLAEARPLYRRVASDFPGTDRAGLSLMRLAGSYFLQGDHRRAAEAWEEYRAAYPDGERWLEATYWAGRALEAAGDSDSAHARYRDLRQREPLSYYTVQASERLGEPFWPPPLTASPAPDSAAEARVAEWMHAVDLLLAAGLHSEAEAEADRAISAAGEATELLYPLAEALIERGLTVRGIRIGLRLQETEERNRRLLRIVYPFPYRSLIESEARERGVDPYLAAALIRQESLFKARIASPVGARGLMQVMPETGRGLASSVGIDGWDVELLYQPEINTHLGMRFLAEQMRRWDSSLPAVFSAYNAGPNRIDQWSRRFPEFGNEELFTERIPYRETRDYVKILTRNIAVYRGLYGESGGGAAGGE